MSGAIEAKLAELGITLPEAAAPAANYVPYVKSGNQLFISGQIPQTAAGEKVIGKLGDTMETEAGQEAAKLCAISLIAQMKAATGDLDKVARVVKLVGFVNSTLEFGDQPAVINGASNFMVDVFGGQGPPCPFSRFRSPPFRSVLPLKWKPLSSWKTNFSGACPSDDG